MKSELLPNEMYVLCVSCLIAHRVDSYNEAKQVMRGHTQLIPSHHHSRKKRPTETRLFVHNGNEFNAWAMTQVDDPREVIIGELV